MMSQPKTAQQAKTSGVGSVQKTRRKGAASLPILAAPEAQTPEQMPNGLPNKAVLMIIAVSTLAFLAFAWMAILAA